MLMNEDCGFYELLMNEVWLSWLPVIGHSSRRYSQQWLDAASASKKEHGEVYT
jgi:hypothetical protein